MNDILALIHILVFVGVYTVMMHDHSWVPV
jgi:hypothetical protein